MKRPGRIGGIFVLVGLVCSCWLRSAHAVVREEPEADRSLIPSQASIRKGDVPISNQPIQSILDRTRARKAVYVPGQFIVKFKPSLTQCAHCLLEKKQRFAPALPDFSDSIDQLNRQCQVKAARSVFVRRCGHSILQAQANEQRQLAATKQKFSKRTARASKSAAIPDLTNVYLFEVPQEADIQALCQLYANDPHVEYAQPNYLVEAQVVPNDPYYASVGSWGQPYDDLWGLKKIQVEQAWDVTQGQGIVVAVVDTGLDYNHPDIAANVWTNPDEIPNNGVDDDGNGFIDDVRGWDFANSDNDPMDGFGHGTHVSGTIAAVGNNNLGIIGVVPKAKILPIKGLDDAGGGTVDWLANGLVYAAQNGADVINNSWGCNLPCPSNPIAEDAVRTAFGLGAVVVFAAGNNNSDVASYSPQNMTNPKPIVVAATTEIDAPTYFTNFGVLVDVTAPGGGEVYPPQQIFEQAQNILSLKSAVTYPGMDGNGQLIVGQQYLRQAGTSMAAPHAAGLAALILANRPPFTNDAVRQVLQVSGNLVNTPGSDIWNRERLIGVGRINAAKALTVESVPQVKITSPASGTTFTPHSVGSVTIIGTASGTDFKQYELSYGLGNPPQQWIPIGAPTLDQVVDGVLGVWPIGQLPIGLYTLRLVVSTQSGLEFKEAVSIAIEPSFTQTPEAPQSQFYPTISGDRIVWLDARNSRFDLYLYDLATNTEHRITTDQASTADIPAISENLIVWRDWRNFDFSTETGSTDLYLCTYNPLTGTCPERQLTSQPGDQWIPAISGNLIVWEDWRGGNADIYLYDLAADRERPIVTNLANQYEPDISGNRIVWRDGRNGKDWNIYLYDLTTNMERQITSNPSHELFPAISGDLIVWLDSRANRFDLYLYDLATNTEHRITTDQARPAGPNGYGRYFDTSGNWIVWQDYRNGNEDIYFCQYDPASGACPEQQLTANPTPQASPAISGNRVVWQDWRNGTPHISLYELASQDTVNRPPVLTNPELVQGRQMFEDFDGTSLVQTWWDGDGAAVYQRSIQPPAAEGTNAMRVDFNKNNVPWSFFAAQPIQDGIANDFTGLSRLRLWVNGQVELLVKLETTSGESFEQLVRTVTPSPSDWEPLVVDLSGASLNLGSIANVLFFGAPGDATATGTFSLDGLLQQWEVLLQLTAGQSFQLLLEAVDPDGDPLTYTVNPLPPGASLDSATQTFSWTPAAEQVGAYSVTFTVSDGSLSDSETVTFMVEGDTAPPVITAVQATNITTSKATITWITNEPATSQVEYGLTSNYGNQSPLDTKLVTSHSVILSNLQSSTMYHYRVRSKDAAGNEALSSDQTFTTQASSYTLTASPNTVSPGGSLTISWTAPSGRPTTDWIGLYKVGDPNTSYKWWKYTGGQPSGSFTLTAPTTIGQYAFRYLLSNGYTEPAPPARAAVTVGSGGTTPTLVLTATPTTISPGGSSTLTWTSTNTTSCSAVSPPNWTTSTATSGSQTVSPSSTTSYSMSCTGAAGSVSQVVTVTVGTTTYTLTASPETIAPGGSLTISWTAPSGRPTTDWIGLYRVGDPNTAYKWWKYTGGQPSGSFTLTAPATIGQYEFRYLLQNGYTEAARSNVVTVGSSGGGGPSLSFSATPTTISSGQSSTLSWTSTNATSCTAEGGWSGTKPLSGSEPVSPTTTTSYSLTCTNPTGSVTKSVTVTVSSGGTSYTLTASPNTVSPGGSLTISWTAPSGRPTTDWIGLYKVGDPNTSYKWWKYTGGQPSGSFTLTAPTTIGQYEFRYLLQNGYTEAARSNPVDVTTSTATAASVNDAAPQVPYNFVVILTDDQRWDTITPEIMPRLNNRIISQGVNFANAFVTLPLCCPDRASLLSGGFYAHNTGVLGNEFPNGGFKKFNDKDSLAATLQNAGYKTAMIGKYLNGYPLTSAYIPPGWTKFVATAGPDWFNYKAAIGSSGSTASTGSVEDISQYLTDFEEDQALDFIRQSGDQPFFLYFSTQAPHEPATPAEVDETLFSDFDYATRPDNRAYGEEDLSDKPVWLRNAAQTFDQKELEEAEFRRNQLRSLQAVDRAIEAIVGEIESKGKFNQTVFIFTSDNGYLWGEHKIRAKGRPHEESIRVPFVVRMPGVTPRTDDHLIASNLDIGATIFALAGISKASEGRSLAPLLSDPNVAWRGNVFLEHYEGIPVWTGLRTPRWKYIEYATGEKELYDLQHDPFEERSQHLSADPKYKTARDELARQLESRKGLAITTQSLPGGTVGVNYSFQLSAWGGVPPYTWSVYTGEVGEKLPKPVPLPPGLFLSSSGLLSGVPSTTFPPAEIQDPWAIWIKVQDSSIAKQSRQAQSHFDAFKIVVRSPGTGDATAPTVSIVSPADGSTVSGVVDIYANTSDNVRVTGVQFRLGEGNLGVENSEAPYITSWDTTKVADGRYTLKARARDAAGNIGISTAVVLNVDNIFTNAQFISQSVPTSMTTGQSYSVAVTVKNTGNTTWTKTANYKLGSQNPQDNRTWGMGRVALDDLDAIAPGQSKTFTFNVTAPAAPGTYNFQWRMVQESVQWFGDITPNVVVTVAQPPSNQPPTANSQFVTTPEDTAKTLTLTGSDPESSPLAFSIVTPPVKGTLSPITNLSATSAAVTYTPNQNFNGSDSFTFKVNDGALDSPPASVALSVSPVNDPPLANAGPDQTATIGSAVSFDGSGSSDVDGTITSYTWHFGDGAPTATGITVSHTYTTLGTVTVTLTVTDDQGATGTDTALITTSDSIPPSGSVTINGGAAITKTPTVMLTLSATDNSGLMSHMQLSNDGTTYSAPEAYATTKDWTLSNGDGTKTIYAKFKDQAGNWSAAATDMILLDTSPPLVSITSPANGTTVSGTVMVNAAASDNSGIAKVEFSVDGSHRATDTSSPYSYGWDTTIDSKGLHTVQATASDAAGNPANHSIVVTVSNQAPTPTLSLTATPTTISSGQSSTLSWSSTNATACTAEGGWSGVKPTSGTETVSPTTTTTYSLTCTGPGGTVTQSATVTVSTGGQTYTLTASPSSVAPGGSLTVSWIAPSGRPTSDWIGLYKVGDPNTRYNWWSYTKGAPSGSFTLTAPLSPGPYEFRYLLNGGYTEPTPPARASLTVGSESTPLTITTSSLPDAVVNQSYSQPVSASGGTPPYSWRLASGTLPTGLSLSPSGTLSGTPTMAGTGNFTVEVKDNVSASATKTLSLTVRSSLPAPTLTFSANPTTISSGQSSTLSWSSTNTSSCSASGGWSGSKPTSGSASISPTTTTIYSLTCTGSGGSLTKSVTVTVSSGTTTYTLIANPSAVSPGGALTISWTAPSGRPASDWIGLYRGGDPNTAYKWWRYTNGETSGSITLAAPTSAGQYEFRYLLNGGYTEAARSNSVTIGQETGPTLTLSLTASPSSGPAPLTGVDLTADVGGSATGPMSLSFDCTNDGTWERTVPDLTTEPYTAVDLCSYPSAGTYTTKAQVLRQGLSASTAVTITVGTSATYALSATPNTVALGGSLTISWTAPSSRPSSDWIGLYRVGDPNTAYRWWKYTGGASSGSVRLSAPTTAGQYEFRYLLQNGYTDAAKSNIVTVQ